MPYRIAVAGKGGSGKTTFASLVAYNLVKARKVPVLAVDADPNANFNVSLGLTYEETIADLREEALKSVPAGMPKTQYVNMRLQESVVEGEHIDLLIMGKPEGGGCYCAVNHLLRDHLSKVSQNYRYVIIDNEAGMEHLSRRTTDDVDVLFLVSDPSPVGLRACALAKKTAEGLALKIKRIYLVLNRSVDGLSKASRGIIQEERLEVIGRIPADDELRRAGEEGTSLLLLPENTPAVAAVKEILDKAEI